MSLPTRRSLARIVLLFSLIAGFVGLLGAQEGSDPPQPPPDLLDLDAWKDQVVLVDFWASWCIPCRRSLPWMDEMARKYEQRGLVIVAVNVDESAEAADSFLQGTSYQFEYVYDPEGRLAEHFAIDAMPAPRCQRNRPHAPDRAWWSTNLQQTAPGCGWLSEYQWLSRYRSRSRSRLEGR